MDREIGGRWVLDGCPGCAAVDDRGLPCGLGYDYCVLSWAYKHVDEVKAQLEAEMTGSRREPSPAGVEAVEVTGVPE